MSMSSESQGHNAACLWKGLDLSWLIKKDIKE